jgi:hypothetical protein
MRHWGVVVGQRAPRSVKEFCGMQLAEEALPGVTPYYAVFH